MIEYPQLPKKHYKNLREFISFIVKPYNLKHEYPCPECFGYGKVYDPDDPPCPVEGNKMQDRIACPKCEKKGYVTREIWLGIYKQHKEYESAKVEKIKQQQKTWETIWGKLTPEERTFLGMRKE